MTFGLRFRLALIVLAAAAPALFLTWHTAASERAQQRAMIEDDVMRLAASIAREKEHAFEQTAIILRGLTALPALRSSSATCNNALPRVLDLYPSYVDFFLTDSTGTVTCSTRPATLGTSLAGHDMVRAALASRRVTSGRYERGPLTGDTASILLALHMGETPNWQSGIVIAALRADHVNVASLARFHAGVELVEFDATGRVLNTWPTGLEPLGSSVTDFARIRPHLSDESALVEVAGRDGGDQVVAVAPLPADVGEGLYAGIRMSRNALYSHVDREMRGTVATILLTLTLALVATRLLASGLLLRPVDRLLAATRQIGSGNLAARAGPPYPAGELGGLARAFDRAAATLSTQEEERERALTALRRSEASYQALIENAPYGSVTIDLDGNVRQANPAMMEIVGARDTSEIVGRWTGDFFEDPEDRDRLIARLSESGRAQDVELRLRRVDGRVVLIRGGGRFVHDASGDPVATEWFAEDITERRELESRLLQARKMEAIGRLAGGVAHDFNNLLTVILGYAGSLRDRIAREIDRAEIAEIRHAAQRAQSLTSQLLAFSRKQLLEPRVLDLNGVVREARRILDRVIGENIEIDEQLASSPMTVRADPAQLEQVILNLAANARDAMPRGGRIELRTERRTLEATPDDSLTAGDYVILSVSDTGEGMDQETRARIFEPFFTTKDRGHGTGLGLATVYGIVEQSGGAIHVDSEPGAGTTFRLYLPAEAAPPDSATAARPDHEASGMGETILLIEDDDAVRALVRRYLGGRGYHVLPAASGGEAIDLAASFRGDIDLLLTDVVLPDLTPHEIRARLETTRPGLPAVLMSGYATDVLANHGGVPEDTEFIAKPFDPADLLDVVSRSLRRAPA